MSNEVKISITGDSTDLQQAMTATENSMAESFKRMGGLPDKHLSGFDGFADKIKKNQQAISDVGKGLAAIGVAGAGLFTAAAYSAIDFEASMSNVASVAGATKTELESLSAKARQVGKDTAFSASEAADAQYYLASAGMNTQQIMESLNGVMLLAGATQSNLAFTSETVAAAISQFGLAASDSTRVANVYAAAISGSQATIQKLSDSMRYAGPIAGAMGYSIEQTSAALMVLYNAGFRGEQAGTMIRAGLLAMANPSKEAATAMEEIGLKVTDSSGKMLEMDDIVRQLSAANIDAGQAAKIFGSEAAAAWLSLSRAGGDALENLEKKITDTNKAQEMYKTQLDNTKGVLVELKSSVEALAISVGDTLSPYIREGAKDLKDMVNWLNDLDPTVKTAAVGVGGLATAVGLVGGPALLLIGYLPRIKEGLDLVNLSASKLGKTVGVLGAAWAGWEIGSAIYDYATGLSEVEERNKALDRYLKGQAALHKKQSEERMAAKKAEADAEEEKTEAAQKSAAQEKAALDKAIEGLEKYSAKIKEIGREQLAMSKESFSANLKIAVDAGDIAAANAALDTYRDNIYAVYSAQVEQYQDVKAILLEQGDTKNSLLRQDLNIAQAEKASITDKLSAYQSYYSSLESMHAKAVKDQETAIKELQEMEQAAADRKQSSTNMVLDLERTLMSEEKKHYSIQEQLDDQYSAAMAMTGEEKIKALQDYQRSASQNAKEVKDGNDIIITSEEAVAAAIYRIEEAQRAMEEEEEALLAAQQAKIEAAQTWVTTIEDGMSSVRGQITAFKAELIAVQSQIDSMEMRLALEVDTSAASSAVDRFIKKYDGQQIEVILDLKMKASPVGGFTDKMDYVDDRFDALPTQGTYTIDASEATATLTDLLESMSTLRSDMAAVAPRTVDYGMFGREGKGGTNPRYTAYKESLNQYQRLYDGIFNSMYQGGGVSSSSSSSAVTAQASGAVYQITVDVGGIIIQSDPNPSTTAQTVSDSMVDQIDAALRKRGTRTT